MVRSTRLLPTPSDVPRAAVNVRAAIQAVAFWAGVALPLVHVPLLLLVDHGWFVAVDVVAGLVTANVVAILIGHGHDPSPSD